MNWLVRIIEDQYILPQKDVYFWHNCVAWTSISYPCPICFPIDTHGSAWIQESSLGCLKDALLKNVTLLLLPWLIWFVEFCLFVWSIFKYITFLMWQAPMPGSAPGPQVIMCQCSCRLVNKPIFFRAVCNPSWPLLTLIHQ